MSIRQFAPLISILFFVSVASGAPTTAPSPGLIAKYSDGENTVTTIVSTPNFALSENQSVHPQIKPNFTATYEGQISISDRYDYTFRGEASITIDGVPVLLDPVRLEPGLHSVHIEVKRRPGPARLQLMWNANFKQEPVPFSVLSHHDEPPEVTAAAEIERGRMLVEELNCVACHRTQSKVISGRSAPDLSSIGNRANGFWIYKWLDNPRHFRAGALMPAMLPKEGDRVDAAAYLVTLKNQKFSQKNEPSKEERVKRGKELFETIGCAVCHGKDGVALAGLGSKTNFGELSHDLQDPLAVDRSGRMPAMALKPEEANPIADYLLQSKNKDFEGKLPAGDAKHGEQIIRTSGCLNCHSMQSDKSKPSFAPSSLEKFPLEKLDPARGCLAKSREESTPRFDLSDEQRKAIRSFVVAQKVQPFVAVAPAHEFYRTVQKFNCSACHDINSLHPSDELPEKAPNLTDAGAKLRKDWMNDVFAQKKRLRWWSKLRMPNFGSQNSNEFANCIVAASGAGDPPAPVAVEKDAIELGRTLAGKEEHGLACVACHSFKDYKPEVLDATRAPDLTMIASRVRSDYFARWLRDPPRVQPGTPMPSFFTGVPEKEIVPTIEALWAYFSLEDKMPIPHGLGEVQGMTVSADAQPLIYRANMPNLGEGKYPRGVAVGFSNNVSYCFDAAACQFRYAWSGGFLNMHDVWTARGGGVAKLLGTPFYNAPNYSPVRVGDLRHVPQCVFKGYRMVDKFPQFIYTVDDVEIYELVQPVQTGIGITRTFEIPSTDKPIFFLASNDPKLTFTPSAGEFKKTDLPAEAGGASTTVNSLEIPKGEKIKFSIAVSVKEKK